MATLTEKLSVTITIGDQVYQLTHSEQTTVEGAVMFSKNIGNSDEPLYPNGFPFLGTDQPYFFFAVNRSEVNIATVRANESGGAKDVSFDAPPNGSVEFSYSTGVLNTSAGGTITATMVDAEYTAQFDNNTGRLECFAVYKA